MFYGMEVSWWWYGSVDVAWRGGDGGMGVLIWHGGEVMVVWECFMAWK